MGEQQGSLKQNKREKIKKKRKEKNFFSNLTTTNKKQTKKYANISRIFSGAVAVSVGSVQYQRAPFPAYTS